MAGSGAAFLSSLEMSTKDIVEGPDVAHPHGPCQRSLLLLAAVLIDFPAIGHEFTPVCERILAQAHSFILVAPFGPEIAVVLLIKYVVAPAIFPFRVPKDVMPQLFFL